MSQEKHYELVPELDERFWDCECESNYIKALSQESCPLCGAFEDDQMSSMHIEVQQRFLEVVESLKERSRERYQL